MALPRDFEFRVTELETISSDLTAIDTAIAALPATPVEADLPDIVAIIVNIHAATNTLNTTLTEFIKLLRKVRIGQ